MKRISTPFSRALWYTSVAALATLSSARERVSMCQGPRRRNQVSPVIGWSSMIVGHASTPGGQGGMGHGMTGCGVAASPIGHHRYSSWGSAVKRGKERAPAGSRAPARLEAGQRLALVAVDVEDLLKFG